MLNKLKSLFIVEDHSQKKEESTTESNKTAPKTKVSNTPLPSSDTVKIDSNQKPTAKFVDILLKAIDDANQDGFDYLEFKQSLQSLSKMDMDDNTRYKSAVAMASTMGANTDHLISSASKYMDVLKKEDQKFQQALASQRQKQVQGGAESLTKAKDNIKAKKARIEQLKKEIAASETKLAELEKKVAGAESKIENTRIGFAAAYQSVTTQIKTDIDRLKKLK